ncbi:hypothetical protein M408DRAFT_12768 [Serendipita vermifera MAFF 305830]|uniref:Uncharacterized protein n=1 Tax=Serendipita vermifera MAFF 305830 TaxID=933852 RepID=A0A0C3A8W7_SERVB|nr:hypothetical protein M408DRAFT_12768 [Serendipita vermifera MAFF 305830]
MVLFAFGRDADSWLIGNPLFTALNEEGYCHLAEILIDEQDDVVLFRVADLVRRLDISVPSLRPSQYRSEYIFFRRIPSEVVVGCQVLPRVHTEERVGEERNSLAGSAKESAYKWPDAREASTKHWIHQISSGHEDVEAHAPDNEGDNGAMKEWVDTGYPANKICNPHRAIWRKKAGWLSEAVIRDGERGDACGVNGGDKEHKDCNSRVEYQPTAFGGVSGLAKCLREADERGAGM